MNADVLLSAGNDSAEIPDEPNGQQTHYDRGNSPSEPDNDSTKSFDSQSSVEAEHDAGLKKTLGARLRIAIHLPTGKSASPIEPVVPSLDEYDPGYGKVAAIEDLDGDFIVYRRFGWLHNYTLLNLQDEISELQEELEGFNKWEAQSGDRKKLTSRRRDASFKNSKRKVLLEKIHAKLKEYHEALLRMQDIQSMRRPTKRSQKNVHNLIHNTRSLEESEVTWIQHSPDLVAPGCGAEYGWFNTFLEDTLSKIWPKLTIGLFRTTEQRLKSGNEDLRLLSAKRLDNLARIILTIVAVALLLFPAYALFRLQPTNQKEFHRKSSYQILMVFIFTLLFSLSCSMFTKARKQDVFTATAAYCAVLVVFLGNTSNVMLAPPG